MDIEAKVDKTNDIIRKVQDVIDGEEFEYVYVAFCAICYDANKRGIFSDEDIEDFQYITEEIGKCLD
jgi:hypothetical protein